MRTGKNARKRAEREIARLGALAPIWGRIERDAQRYGAAESIERASNMNSVSERKELFRAIDESKHASGKFKIYALGKTENKA